MSSQNGQTMYYLPGLAQFNGSSWEYFAKDRLRSVRQLVDSNGQVALVQSYDPFGNKLEQSGAGQSAFGYTKEQTDPSGLVFLRARYYNPAVGRFLSADSLVPDPLRSIGWNRYAYVYNNPVRYIDPSGRCSEVPIAEVGEEPFDPCEGGGLGGSSSGSGSLGGGRGGGGGTGGSGGTPSTGGGGGGAGATEPINQCVAPPASRQPTWPNTPGGMDDILGMPGTRIPDGPTTPGRGKVTWNPSDTLISREIRGDIKRVE